MKNAARNMFSFRETQHNLEWLQKCLSINQKLKNGYFSCPVHSFQADSNLAVVISVWSTQQQQMTVWLNTLYRIESIHSMMRFVVICRGC